MPSLPVISTQNSRAAIDVLLDEASPEVRNPAGEPVIVDTAWADEVEGDPQRLGLLPAALTALRDAQEVWMFKEDDAGRGSIEHQPHLLWCQLDDASVTELVVGGTRRVAGKLQLHTWFRMADPQETVSRYLRRGARTFPPLKLRTVYQERTDVLYLEPEQPDTYRVIRLSADTPVYAYLSEARGFSSLAGFEFQDARRRGPELRDDPALTQLLTTPCDLQGSNTTLGEHLSQLMDWG